MPQIPHETVEQVLAATDIVDLIGSYIPVKRAGVRFVALCPFHHEKTPSFSIDPARQFFHCFGCKKSGDAITFVREHENLTFVDAVKKLAHRSGVPVVEEAVDPREERDRRKRGRLLDLHREASRFFHQLLLEAPEARHARDYLRARGFDGQMARRWELGWAPDPGRKFLDWARERQISGRDLVDSGLALQRESGGLYLRFRDRLMFPIRNDHGDVIAFSGRQLREDPRSGKYINSPETPLFRKSNVLFALDKARKAILDQKCALLCEGQIDAIACHEQGIAHAIAPLGTAFTPQHARNLKRYTKRALLCFDADSAGFSAAERAFRELAAEGVGVRVVRMPPGEDPDSYMKREGPDAFRALLEGALDFFDFLIERAGEDDRLAEPQERAAFTRECAPLLAIVSDPVTRDAMINHVATRLRTGVPEMRDAVARAARAGQRRFDRRPAADEAPATPAAEPTPLEPVVGYLCSLALRSAAARQWLGEQLETLHEVAPHLEGTELLGTILTGAPESTEPAAVNSFLAGLEEPQRLALHADPTFLDEPPEDPRAAAEEALASASSIALQREDDAIKAELNQSGLPFERQVALMQRAKEIAELIAPLKNKAYNTDRFISQRRRKAPGAGDKKRHSGPERKP